MKIEASDRVLYANNPLAEVVCQLKFAPLEQFGNNGHEGFSAALTAKGYVQLRREETLALGQPIINIAPQNEADGKVGSQHHVAFPTVVVFHQLTADAAWQVSYSNDFVALTCLRYSTWSDFHQRLLDLFSSFQSLYPALVPVRIGLRYKDVIEREVLGLEGVAWHELIQPFLLGPLAPNALADGQIPDEADAPSFTSQCQFELEDCKLLLISALLTGADQQRRAFLIDADFYQDEVLSENLFKSNEELSMCLNTLHEGAGALFRRGITEKLHDALGPKS